MKKSELIKAAKALNELMELDPGIDIAATEEIIKEQFYEAFECLEPGDQNELSPEVLQTVTEIAKEELDQLSSKAVDALIEVGILEGKNEEEDPEPEEKPKEEDPKPKSKGVIAAIAQLIETAGKKGITKEEIHKALVKQFPSRTEKSMMNTINVQVPNRITKERFEVKKTKDGKYYKA